MKCSKVRTSLSAMNDGRLRESEQAAVVEHLADCIDCQSFDQELKFVGLALREVAPKRCPVDLTFRLRVLASHERVRMVAGANWWSSVRFHLNQVLRPLAVPIAGGIFASLLFFAILVPSFTVHASTTNDVPVGLYTQVTILEPSPFAYHCQDVMVELTIDENGAVSNISTPLGGQLSNDQMRAIGNFLLFTSFKAATAFGQPVTSKLLLNISHIDVRS